MHCQQLHSILLVLISLEGMVSCVNEAMPSAGILGGEGVGQCLPCRILLLVALEAHGVLALASEKGRSFGEAHGRNGVIFGNPHFGPDIPQAATTDESTLAHTTEGTLQIDHHDVASSIVGRQKHASPVDCASAGSSHRTAIAQSCSILLIAVPHRSTIKTAMMMTPQQTSSST